MDVASLIRNLPARTASELAVMRERAAEWARSADPAKSDAGRQMVVAIDALDASEREQLSASPLERRVQRAFQQRPCTDHERTLIVSLLDHPGSSTTELNRIVGLGDNMVWQMHFGNMCKARTDILGPPPQSSSRQGDFWSGLLVDVDANNRFTMKPDAIKAFQKLGLRRNRL